MPPYLFFTAPVEESPRDYAASTSYIAKYCAVLDFQICNVYTIDERGAGRLLIWRFM